MNSTLVEASLGVVGAGEVLAFLAGRLLGGRSARAFHLLAFAGAVALGMVLVGAVR